MKYIIAVEKEKHLVLCKNDKFGNWNLGYEMKRKVQDVEPIVADLDRIDNNDLEVWEMPTNAASSRFDEMDDFKRSPFQKKDSLIIV